MMYAEILRDHHRLFVLNHDKKTKQDFCHEPGEHYGEDVKNALDYLFAHDNCSHLPLSVDEEDHVRSTCPPAVVWRYWRCSVC